MKRISKNRLVLTDRERNPNWVAKPYVNIITLRALNDMLGTRYTQDDKMLIEQDLQVSVIGEIPYGRHRMLLIDADEAMARAQLLESDVTPPPIVSAHAMDVIKNMQATINLQKRKIASLKAKIKDSE